MTSVVGTFLAGSSLIASTVGFFGKVSLLSDDCEAVVVVVVVTEFVLIVVVVIVSVGLACFIVECNFALLVRFGLSSDAAVRCYNFIMHTSLLIIRA